jgi:hypothetical protein
MDNRKNHISDEELDELFKSMSEGLSVDFEPEAWQKLDAMLLANTPMPSEQFWKNPRILLSLLLLLFVGATYWFIHQSTQQEAVAKIKAQTQKQIIQKQGSIRIVQKQAKGIAVDRRASDFTRVEDAAKGKDVLQKRNSNKQEIGIPKVVNDRQQLNRLWKSSQDAGGVVLKEETVLLNQSAAYRSDHADERTNVEMPIRDTLNAIVNRTDSRAFLSAKFLDTSLTIALPKVNVSSLYSAQKVENKLLAKSPFMKRGLVLGLYFSPDLTTIANNRIEKIGTNYAVQLEYRFSSRWSVQTGVIRSKKVYDAYGDQYEIPLKWNAGVMPQRVDAVCDMLDIPLNIRYDITQHPEKRVFITTGLTSYVMLKEAYYYTYDTKIAGTHDSWIGTSGPFLISNLNFSIGYEARITNRLTWQAEPFVRVPISSIGWSKVNLFTLGSFVSIKYRFK